MNLALEYFLKLLGDIRREGCPWPRFELHESTERDGSVRLGVFDPALNETIAAMRYAYCDGVVGDYWIGAKKPVIFKSQFVPDYALPAVNAPSPLPKAQQEIETVVRSNFEEFKRAFAAQRGS